MDGLKKEIAKTLHEKIHEMHDASEFLFDYDESNDSEASASLEKSAKDVFNLLGMFYNLHR